VIATEGKVTEKQYFSIFGSLRVQVQILPTGEDNRSSPEYVLDRLREFHATYDLGGEDELWLMVDVDRWGATKLARITKEAADMGVKLAISNPCFEVWLLCHHVEHLDEANRCNDVIRALRTVLGGSYSKVNLSLDQFKPYVELAIKHAETNDAHPRSRWPHKIGTHVYRVIRNLPKD
jgi:hypothetical protein